MVEIPAMNLLTLRLKHRHLFHPTQDWFVHEAFMETPIELPLKFPDHVVPYSSPPHAAIAIEELPLAVNLAALYITNPYDEIWRRYLWCRDQDSAGHRVFVGVNDRGFEVHRHLHPDERWAWPVMP